MKKKWVINISLIVIIILSILGIILYPRYLENKEINRLSNKVSIVNNYIIKGEGNIDDIKNNLNREVTTGERKTIEESLDNYLTIILDNVIELNNIVNSNQELSLNQLETKDVIKEKIDLLKNNADRLEIIKINLDNAFSDKEDIEDIELKKLYDELISKMSFEETNEKINENIINNNKIQTIMEFFYNDSNWKIEDNKIVFTKRNSYNEYKKLGIETIDYELIKDTTGPVITASNITILKYKKINILDKVKCEDSVDGKTECKISGSYDSDKVGTYSIKITSTDLSNNTTSKTITITVKEEINTKPYYIEIIRNHNVILVYGLDDNNKYTKLVKVIPCSVGLSSTKTPAGYFRTSDKAKWGLLMGGVYGQYYTRITGGVLFHSVPYAKKDKSTLKWAEYNKLGSAASHGCVRLTVIDAKWIYENCPSGTTVRVYDGNLPSGVSKPTTIKISSSSPNKGWDPTDPDPANPWNK